MRNHRMSCWWVLLGSISFIACERAMAQNSGEVFDRVIASQPFDTDVFRQVAVPDWLQDLTGCGYTLSVMSAEQREKAAAHGVKISEMGFVDPFYAYYDSKLLTRRSPHVPPERLRDEIAEYRRLGIRILGVYPPCLQAEVYEGHPDWRRIAENTTEIPQTDLVQFPHGGMLCLLGPYGDFFIEVLAEILTTFPEVDAFSFDGLHYGGVCYCEHCRRNYRESTGDEIPSVDMNDPGFRRYQHWADRRMENLIRRMQIRLKGIKPEVALVTWTTNAGRFGHFLSIPRNMPARMNLLLDAPDQEFWMDESNRGATIIPAFSNAYIWACTNHRVAFSEPYLMSHGNPYGKDSFPPEEVLHRMLMAAAWGAGPSIAVLQPENLQPAMWECLKEVHRRREWLTRKSPEPWAALVMSDNTRNFYGRSAGQVEERYLSSVFGMFRAVVEEHLPVTVINDWNLTREDLARYRVLLLPNTACLDENQTTAVREYVQGGGGLVASLDTSLFDEFGTPRNNFALADVLGADYRGVISENTVTPQELDVNFARGIGPDYWEKRKNVFDFRQDPSSFLNRDRMTVYVGDQPVTFRGPAVRVQPNASVAKVNGWLRLKTGPHAEEYPAVMTRQFGRGRVVYLAGGFDAACYLYSYPYLRLMLKNAILEAAGENPPIRISAPMCVQSTVMRQTEVRSSGPDGAETDCSRLVIHLFNNLNTTANHGFPNDDVPLREETIPISDIQVTISDRYSVQSAMLQPENLPLELVPSAAGITVRLPPLNVHSMVVVNLDAPAEQ